MSSGYLSGNSYRLHFGLGKGTKIFDAKVVWPDGKEEKIDIEKNKLIRITRTT